MTHYKLVFAIRCNLDNNDHGTIQQTSTFHFPTLSLVLQLFSTHVMRLGSFVSAATFVVCAVAQNVFYDTTWGGPVRLAERFNGTAGGFDRVEATLVIPELAIPKNPHAPSDEYTAAYWIGLGGFLSSNVVKGLWQAGVIMSIWNNGSTEYMGFYEWQVSEIPRAHMSVHLPDVQGSE